MRPRHNRIGFRKPDDDSSGFIFMFLTEMHSSKPLSYILVIVCKLYMLKNKVEVKAFTYQYAHG